MKIYNKIFFARSGYFLNPQYQYHKSVRNDEEVINGFRHVVDRLETSATTRLEIKKEVKCQKHPD